MLQQVYQPHPALQGFVRNIMIHQVQFDASATAGNFFIPPPAENALFFYVRDPLASKNIATKTTTILSPATIVGPTFDQHSIAPGRDHLMIKVGFQPGGLYRFTGVPMTELLTADAVDAPALLGGSLHAINEQLKEAVSIDDMKAIVENFLLQYVHRLKQSLPIDNALALLIEQRGLVKIDQLASLACLSVRQFERVFAERVGLPPKHFSRLVRFEKAWMLKQHDPRISWTSIAHECGYFDQMHLIRDFREFAGVSPGAIEGELIKSQEQFFSRG